ncbi:hypothetical protein TSUD_298100 [Trifolium subterraneum]|nr:hypothetical protein TSUD_298100 [Trifolium subterraneum]
MKRERTTTNFFASLSETETTPASYLYLPDECWESVFKFLIDDNDNHRYLEPLSLASKQFLSITNRLRSSITICGPTLPFIPTLFHRFPNLSSLHFKRFKGDLNSLLSQISSFPFNLKSLKLSNQSEFPVKGLRALSKNITTLTSLTCSNIDSLSNNHFVLISECFPFLEELHLQHNPISYEVGVTAMLTALPKLRKINLCGYGYYEMNDSLFLHLCKNCEFLEDIVMLKCQKLTLNGIATAIRQRPTLRSIYFRWDGVVNISSHFIDSLISLKGLTCLDLWRMQISDELLSSMAKGNLPLRRICLEYCKGYSYAGLFSLLSKYRRIQHLDLQFTDLLNDHHIVKLSSLLGDLVSINLSYCSNLTDSALIALDRNCPSLSDIKMKYTRIGKNIVENSKSLNDFVLNPQLKSLHLADSLCLTNESLIIFASIFPNLQLLDLGDCKDISDEVPKLEMLNLSNTCIDDETLYVISNCCFGLLQLALNFCENVTNKGVKHMIENCKQLREIDLECCDKVCANIVEKMIYFSEKLLDILMSVCSSIYEF